MADHDDLTWLVDRRSRIQRLLLRLHDASEAHEEALSVGELERPLFGLVLGAAFSLWRAAFLVGGEREPEAILDDARKFLVRLVRDNAINYPQDREARIWSAGYYLHNASFHIEAISRLFQKRIPDDVRAEMASAVRAVDAEQWDFASSDPRKQWDIAYNATAAAADVLDRLLPKEHP